MPSETPGETLEEQVGGYVMVDSGRIIASWVGRARWRIGVMSFAIPDIEWLCGGRSLLHMRRRTLPASCQLLGWRSLWPYGILRKLGCSCGWHRMRGARRIVG